MVKVVSVSFGEVALKGKNRSYFVNKLIKHLKRVIRNFDNTNVYQDRSKIFIEAEEEDIDEIANIVKKVFGIVLISKCYKIDKDMDLLRECAVKVMEEESEKREIKTFKVDAKRGDKKFHLNSMEIERDLGGVILKNVNDISVDVHNPDIYVYVEVRDFCYVYTEKIKAYGGLPVGTNGKGILLLSGGIDSPVAGFMMSKRGIKIDCVHYHSYPFTSERAEEKVMSLAKIMAQYCGDMRIHSVNILNIQKSINENCPQSQMTIISRRFMMRIAEKIALENDHDALITGESLGQVASQTIKGLNATNASVTLPVFRPLIGMDKTDIIEIAQDIKTFETSILPYEDCCSVFSPKHPVTRPKLEAIEKSESNLNIDELIKEAIDNKTVRTIKY
ncbi:tRNA uracil 4-sulfurtransferase ThiI [Abyssisolibacter fermentans]|uniref:tRNA uracil 4-sulfurtransferase ThiI n=1 Tax=Abyssisolibacter fermentans TaxID=1766203 RepID=UPI00082E51C8|nr:tRNA uracil 4-sulfurtransferase ThiI [Abyssisolibacter fermentans]